MSLRVKLVLVVIVALLPLVASGCGGSNMAAMALSPSMKSADGAARDAAEGSQSGAVTTWKRSRLVPNTSKLMVGDRESLPIRGMHAKIHVDGFRARVVLDYYFANPHDRGLEGTFKVRLPDSASPYFFAFGETLVMAGDAAPAQPASVERARAMGAAPAMIMADRQQSWRGPKEARMVPREKAAIAYGSTVRRAIDPALMEWSGAGMFSARVFPIAARKQHRIVIAYDLQLLPVGDDLELRFDVPQDVPSMTVDFDVAKLPAGKLQLNPPVSGVEEGGRAYFRFAQPQERALTLRITSPPTLVLTGDDPQVGSFFATTFVPKLPAAAASAVTDRAVFLVDTSLSSNPDGFNVWLKMLRALLDNNRDSIKQFAVLYFNVEASWWRGQLSANEPAEVDALLADAQQLVLEGATDLGAALREAAHPRWLTDGKPHDMFLLSDGAATWGESDLFAMSRAMGNGRALFAYRTGLAGSDSAALELLTRETGGALFSVVGEAEIKKASMAHRKRPWRIEEVRLAGSDDLLLAGRPKVLFPGQRVTMVGRGKPTSGAVVELSVAQGGAQQKVVTTTLTHALASDLTARTYGQLAVNQLEELGVVTERTATPYAMHFRVTGKSCSLLMLESEEDYRRHNILPQENALVVSKRPAAAAVKTALGQVASSLGNPKARMLLWLAKMQRTPGVKLDLSESLRLTLKELPRSAYAAPAAPLMIRGRTKQSVPSGLLEVLATRCSPATSASPRWSGG